MSKCVVKGCRNVQGRAQSKSFHKFPFRQPQQLEKWLHSVNLSGTKLRPWSRICSDHFDQAYFTNLSGPIHRRRLKDSAVPTLCLQLQEYEVSNGHTVADHNYASAADSTSVLCDAQHTLLSTSPHHQLQMTSSQQLASVVHVASVGGLKQTFFQPTFLNQNGFIMPVMYVINPTCVQTSHVTRDTSAQTWATTTTTAAAINTVSQADMENIHSSYRNEIEQSAHIACGNESEVTPLGACKVETEELSHSACTDELVKSVVLSDQETVANGYDQVLDMDLLQELYANQSHADLKTSYDGDVATANSSGHCELDATESGLPTVVNCVPQSSVKGLSCVRSSGRSKKNLLQVRRISGVAMQRIAMMCQRSRFLDAGNGSRDVEARVESLGRIEKICQEALSRIRRYDRPGEESLLQHSTDSQTVNVDTVTKHDDSHERQCDDNDGKQYVELLSESISQHEQPASIEQQ